MEEQRNINLTSEADMCSNVMVFDNLTILKEFSNIANSLRIEELLETVPTAKKSADKRIKWVPMFDYLKQGIFDAMVRELNELWKNENVPEKLEILEKQKEKFNDVTIGKAWRPQLADVRAQLKAKDVANLQKQKVHLERFAKEYESRVDRLKHTVSAKRDYLKALQMDIQKYLKKNDDCISQINGKFGNHKKLSFINPGNVDLEGMSDPDFKF